MEEYEIEKRILSVVNNYKSENYGEALNIAEDIPDIILDQMRMPNKSMFELSFYMPLTELLQLELDNFESRTIERLKLTGYLLLAIRNTFYESKTNQNTFIGNVEILQTLLKAIDLLFSDDSCSNVAQFSSNSAQTDSCEWIETHSFSASAYVTCISNLMAANSPNAEKLTPLFMPHMMKLLSYRDPDVGQKCASILHHFLINKEFERNISIYRDYIDVCPILSLYKTEGAYSCFVLFCLEILLCIDGFLSDEWFVMEESQILIALDVLSSIESDTCHKRQKGGVSHSVVEFCKSQFKIEADKVLCNDQLESLQPRILSRLTTFLCNCASNFSALLLQADKSCLISALYLLKALTQAADDGAESHCRLSDLSDIDAINNEAETNPIFGFKTDLIKLIAYLAYRNRHNQDLVRDCDGIVLMLTNSQYDGKNPFIREAAVVAIRNLLEGNGENQKVVEKLQCHGGVQNPLLEQMGARVTLEDGKARVVNQR